MTLKRFHNILYFNIFRFHCFFQYWVAKPILAIMAPVARHGGVISRYRDEHENWDDDLIRDLLNNPKGGTSLFLTDRFMGGMEAASAVTFWNLVSALLQMNFYTWKYGMWILAAAAVVTILVSPTPEYLNDFREFRSWSVRESRKFAVITLLVVICIFLAFVSSLAWYISIAISNKPLS